MYENDMPSSFFLSCQKCAEPCVFLVVNWIYLILRRTLCHEWTSFSLWWAKSSIIRRRALGPHPFQKPDRLRPWRWSRLGRMEPVHTRCSGRSIDSRGYENSMKQSCRPRDYPIILYSHCTLEGYNSKVEQHGRDYDFIWFYRTLGNIVVRFI